MEKIFEREIITEGMILADVDITADEKKELEEILKTGCFIIAEAKELSKGLAQKINQEKKDSLILLPGNGAQIAWQYLQDLQVEHPSELVVPVFAKRYWEPGQTPFVTVSRVPLPATIYPQIKKVLVIDDVISSGQTMTLTHKRNSYRFPCADWFAFSWIIQKNSRVKGFKHVSSILRVSKGDEKKSSIISLSTLITDREIVKFYIQKFPPGFFEFLGSLKLKKERG